MIELTRPQRRDMWRKSWKETFASTMEPFARGVTVDGNTYMRTRPVVSRTKSVSMIVLVGRQSVRRNVSVALSRKERRAMWKAQKAGF